MIFIWNSTLYWPLQFIVTSIVTHLNLVSLYQIARFMNDGLRWALVYNKRPASVYVEFKLKGYVVFCFISFLFNYFCARSAMGFSESWFKRTMLLFLSLPLGLVGGRFTQPSCVYGACVQQDSTGRWCYIPNPAITTNINCTGGSGADSTMIGVMNVHFQQGLSIAYYNGVDNTLLGGPDFSVPTTDGIIRLCVSGRAGDGSFQTLCDNVAGDNTIQGAPFCFVALGQNVVSDGCYVPKSGVVVEGGHTVTNPGQTSTSPSSPTANPTTLVSATIATIVTDGVTQTIIEVPQTQTNPAGSKSGGAEKVVVPIVVTFLVLGFLAIGLGVFVWWYKQKMRSRLPKNGPVVPPSVKPNPPVSFRVIIRHFLLIAATTYDPGDWYRRI
jgi:hypothetical protein